MWHSAAKYTAGCVLVATRVRAVVVHSSLNPEMHWVCKQRGKCAGWSWDALDELPRVSDVGSRRVVQSGWEPTHAAPARTPQSLLPCLPVRVTVTSNAAALPGLAPPQALPTGSLAALNAWRAAAGCTLAARNPTEALPFGSVSQRFYPSTPPAEAWRGRSDAFALAAGASCATPVVTRAVEVPAVRTRSRRERAGLGRTQDADFVFYDEQEAPPALRGAKRRAEAAQGSGGITAEDRAALAGKAVADEAPPAVKRLCAGAAGTPVPLVPVPASTPTVTPAAVPPLRPAALGRQAAKAVGASTTRSIQDHEVVWARLPGFPWWPAQVQPPQRDHLAAAHKPGDLLCVFYGQGDYAWLPRHQVRPFACAEYSTRASRKDAGLQKALLAAWDAVGAERPVPDASGALALEQVVRVRVGGM